MGTRLLSRLETLFRNTVSTTDLCPKMAMLWLQDFTKKYFLDTISGQSKLARINGQKGKKLANGCLALIFVLSLSAVQARVDAFPHEQGVVWCLVGGDGEGGEGGGVAHHY